MKKIIFLSVVAFVLLIGSKLAIGCDPGWTSVTIAPGGYPGCPQLSADFCIKCSILSNSMEITLTKFNVVCNGANLASYIDYLTGWMRANYSTVCPGSYKQCNGIDYTIIYFRTPLCFIQDPDDPTNFQSCDNSRCMTSFKVCTNPNGTVTSIPWDPPTIEGNPYPECMNKVWPQPPQSCFHVPSPCAP